MTEMVGSQDIVYSIVGISRAFHNKNFTCELRNLLSGGTIHTEQFRKNHNVLIKF